MLTHMLGCPKGQFFFKGVLYVLSFYSNLIFLFFAFKNLILPLFLFSFNCD
jgi:hypothetical protein